MTTVLTLSRAVAVVWPGAGLSGPSIRMDVSGKKTSSGLLNPRASIDLDAVVEVGVIRTSPDGGTAGAARMTRIAAATPPAASRRTDDLSFIHASRPFSRSGPSCPGLFH